MARKRPHKIRRDRAVRRRNPVAKALIERALGERVVPDRRRYKRKPKHPKPAEPDGA